MSEENSVMQYASISLYKHFLVTIRLSYNFFEE